MNDSGGFDFVADSYWIVSPLLDEHATGGVLNEQGG